MTKVACMIILQIGTIRHLWRSIKTLRKQEPCKDSEQNVSKNAADSSFIDNDILEVWSLLGLHALFVYTKTENVLQYIPFYYYLKMIGLLIFFFIPSATNKNVPAQFLFDKVLVRGVDKIHWFLNYYDEYSDWCKKQIYSLPWRLVDLVFPGLLQYSKSVDWNECQRSRLHCWHLRKKQLQRCKEINPYQPRVISHPISSSPSPIDDQSKTNSRTKISVTQSPLSPNLDLQSKRKLTPDQTNKSGSSISKSILKSKTKRNAVKSPIDRSNSSMFSPVAQSRIHASSVQLKNFSRSHLKKDGKKRMKRLSLPSKLSSPIIRDTKKSRARVSHLSDGKPSLQRVQTPRTPTGFSPKLNSRFRRKSTQKEKKSPSLDNSSLGTNDKLENSDTKTPSSPEKIVTTSTTDSLSSPVISRMKSLLSRKSIGSALRQVVTGNAHIRLRDFLFDLDLPNTSVSYMHANSHELSQNSNLKNNPNVSDDNNNHQELHATQPEKGVIKKRGKRRSTGDILHRRSNQVHATPLKSRKGKKTKESIVSKIDFDQEVHSTVKSPTRVNNIRERKPKSIKKKIISSSTSTIRKMTRKTSSQSNLSGGDFTSRNAGKNILSKKSSISSTSRMKKTEDKGDKSIQKEQSNETNDVSPDEKKTDSPVQELELKRGDFNRNSITDEEKISGQRKKEAKLKQKTSMKLSSNVVRRSKRLASK